MSVYGVNGNEGLPVNQQQKTGVIKKEEFGAGGVFNDAQLAAQRFIEMDKDGDLKISAREYTDGLIDEYVTNGRQLSSKYDNVADFINDKYKEFKKFAGKDDSMNIDEFRSMLEARLAKIDAQTNKAEAAEGGGSVTTPVKSETEYIGSYDYSADGHDYSADWQVEFSNGVSTPNVTVEYESNIPEPEEPNAEKLGYSVSKEVVFGNDSSWAPDVN